MDEFDAPQFIRCECSRTPLLARAGIEDGAPFLWVRHQKGKRTILDMRAFGGRVEIECRECKRIWTISLGQTMEIGKPR